ALTPSDALKPLLASGMLFSAQSRSADQSLAQANVELLIASEVLRALQSSREPLSKVSEENLTDVREGSAQSFQRDVYLFWNYVREESVALTATGFVPKRHLAKINDVLLDKADVQAARDESETARLHFTRLMMEDAGLLKCVEGALQTSGHASDFFSFSLTRRSDRFFQTWRKSSQWNELLHLPIEPRAHEDRSPKAMQVVVRAREYVLALVEQHAAEGWLSLDDLVRIVREQYYEFLFKRTREEFGAVNPYYYYHNPLGWGFPVGDEREGWDKVESEFIRSIVAQPLHWLGLVSLGWQDGRVAAFRFTPLGAYLIGLRAQPPPDESTSGVGRLVVQPNFQIFALEPIAEQMLARLDRFADRVKADRVYEYHLTRDSLYRAQQDGTSVQDVIAFLQQAASSALPQNVERTLEEWGQSYERIIIYSNISLLHALVALS
ncbi:MAG: helicase-associated domain-containing protein, partial [Chloroflexi bacterium]|nr:helicase-associated domain-containing protein [Chloroflexota bacterium]